MTDIVPAARQFVTFVHTIAIAIWWRKWPENAAISSFNLIFNWRKKAFSSRVTQAKFDNIFCLLSQYLWGILTLYGRCKCYHQPLKIDWVCVHSIPLEFSWGWPSMFLNVQLSLRPFPQTALIFADAQLTWYNLWGHTKNNNNKFIIHTINQHLIHLHVTRKEIR